jgi:hypothetical protein
MFHKLHTVVEVSYHQFTEYCSLSDTLKIGLPTARRPERSGAVDTQWDFFQIFFFRDSTGGECIGDSRL